MLSAEPAPMLAQVTPNWLIENWHRMGDIREPAESQARYRELLGEELDRRGIDPTVVVPFRREE